MHLYINDQPADLAEDSPIALTFQINNLAEVKNQQGNTSNQFKLPLTQRNRRILGFPDDVAFNNGSLYNRYTAKIIQDGLEIIPYGVAEINSVDNDAVSITILSGNVDFFDAIDGKLYDMGDKNTPSGAKQPFSAYEHSWSIQNIINSQNKTDGWIWPIVDYGKLDYQPTDSQYTVDVRNLRPGFFLKTAIETIALNAGFSVNPKSPLLADPLYNKLIVQFANDGFEHSADYQTSADNFSTVARKTSTQVLTSPITNSRISFTDTTGTDPSGSFNYDTYVAKESITLDVQLNYGIWLDDITAHGGSPVFAKISIYKRFTNGTFELQVENEHNWGSENHNEPPKEFLKQALNCEVSLQKGDEIFVNYYLWPEHDRVWGKFYSGAQISFTNKKTAVIYGQKIQCERIFPDISQKDLLKDTLQRFGIVCQTDNTNRVITLASFRDIVNNIPIAKNWTAKCLDQGKTITFQLGGYAQVNNLKYKDDDNVLPQSFANAKISVEDKNLPASADLFESQFAPSLNRPYIGGSIAQIKKIEPDGNEFSISTQPRILIDQKFDVRPTGKKIKFTEGSASRDVLYNDEISAPYFYKPDAEELPGDYGKASLHFDDLRKKYYPELEKILQQTKKVVRYLMLTPRDILDLDLLIPVYLEQDGAYYYINKIDSWRKGQPCKVELIKL